MAQVVLQPVRPGVVVREVVVPVQQPRGAQQIDRLLVAPPVAEPAVDAVAQPELVADPALEPDPAFPVDDPLHQLLLDEASSVRRHAVLPDQLVPVDLGVAAVAAAPPRDHEIGRRGVVEETRKRAVVVGQGRAGVEPSERAPALNARLPDEKQPHPGRSA